MICYFYILYSHTLDIYYLGHTCDSLEERLRKHNSAHKGFTGRANDWQIVLSEKYTGKKLAYAREREVKSWKSRKRVEHLFKSNKKG